MILPLPRTDYENLCQRGVFILPVGQQKMSYCMRCVVEGLNGRIPVYSPDQSVPGTLWNDDFAWQNCALTIVDLGEFYGTDPNLAIVNRLPADRTLLFSMADTLAGIAMPNHTLVVTHHCNWIEFPGARIPWAFGISRSMVEETRACQPLASRPRTILRNFRNSESQYLRHALDLSLVPILEKFFHVDRAITQGHPALETIKSDALSRMMSSYACLAYGGTFVVDTSMTGGGIPGARFLKEPLILRWDSWRFWESMVSGTATIQLDFEKYGMQLPVQPVSFKHYIPLDMEYPHRTAEFIRDDPDSVARIAQDGRAFVLEHYKPEAVARRLFGLVADNVDL